MEFTFRYGEKLYCSEAQAIMIEFAGKEIEAIYPLNTAPEWVTLFGNSYSPLFYNDQTPILGSYRKGSEHRTTISQLLYDVKNNRLVTEFLCGISKGKRKMYRLKEIVPTKISESVLFIQ